MATTLATAYGPTVGGWISKTVTAGMGVQTTVSIGGTDGLPNGDVAVAYEFHNTVVFNSGVCAILLQPESIATNMHSVTTTSVNGGAYANGPNADSRIGITTASGFGITIRGEVWAVRGSGARRYTARSSEHTAAATNNLNMFAGVWNEDTTPITKLDFTSSIASGIGVGSVFMVRPLFR